MATPCGPVGGVAGCTHRALAATAGTRTLSRAHLRDSVSLCPDSRQHATVACGSDSKPGAVTCADRAAHLVLVRSTHSALSCKAVPAAGEGGRHTAGDIASSTLQFTPYAKGEQNSMRLQGTEERGKGRSEKPWSAPLQSEVASSRNSSPEQVSTSSPPELQFENNSRAPRYDGSSIVDTRSLYKYLKSLALSAVPSPIVIFKGGGYVYEDLDSLLKSCGLHHVILLTNRINQADCVLCKPQWDTGRRVNLDQVIVQMKKLANLGERCLQRLLAKYVFSIPVTDKPFRSSLF